MASDPSTTPDKINNDIRAALEKLDNINVQEVHLVDYLTPALPKGKEITFHCTDKEGRRSGTGDLFAAYTNGARLIVEGNVGRFTADSMVGGEMVINGNAGRGLAHNLQGGTVVVRGDVDKGAAMLMAGGTLIVDGNAGDASCTAMSGGTVIITGEVAGRLAKSMSGGTIYLAGSIPQLESHIKVRRPTPAKRQELTRLLQGFAIEATGISFNQLIPDKNAVAASPTTAIPAPPSEPEAEMVEDDDDEDDDEVLDALPDEDDEDDVDDEDDEDEDDEDDDDEDDDDEDDDEGPMEAELEAPPRDPMGAAVTATLHDVPPPDKKEEATEDPKPKSKPDAKAKAKKTPAPKKAKADKKEGSK